jgi:hypothetical protein
VNWSRLFFTTDLGQQIDIGDIEDDVVRLRARLHEQARADATHDQALVTLRREVTELKLLVIELSRLLVSSGAVSKEAIGKLASAIEEPETP